MGGICHRKTMSWLSQIKKKEKKGGGRMTSRGFAATADWSLRSLLGWLGILPPFRSPLPLSLHTHTHTRTLFPIQLCGSVQFSRAKMAENKLWLLVSCVCVCICVLFYVSHSLFHILANSVVVFGVTVPRRHYGLTRSNHAIIQTFRGTVLHHQKTANKVNVELF